MGVESSDYQSPYTDQVNLGGPFEPPNSFFRGVNNHICFYGLEIDLMYPVSPCRF